MVLITGGSGFIGRQLIAKLLQAGERVRATTREPANLPCETIVKGKIDGQTDWEKEVTKVRAVIHLAADTRSVRPGSREARQLHQTNVAGTAALARAAVEAGVARLIFLSSVGAVAEASPTPLQVHDPCRPVSPYGQSKQLAEETIKKAARGTGLGWTILRPPLVYGPGQKGLVAKIFPWIRAGWPLPLGAMEKNRRSFVAVANLVDLILQCLVHTQAIDKTLYVSDGDDISTAEFFRRVARSLRKFPREVPFPGAILKAGLPILGRKEWVPKLFENLQVDIGQTKKALGWRPVVTMEEELTRAALWWKSSSDKRDEDED